MERYRNSSIENAMKRQVAEVKEKTRGEEPLVSVIIPIYNAEGYLKILMHSLNEQTYKNLQIICVNDGSTDMSLHILERIKQVDNRIVIINQENSGPAAARNAGLNAATGKYISFIDADDDIDWGMYERLVDVAEENEADIVIFGGNAIPNNTNTPAWIKDKLTPGNYEFSGDNAGTTALFYENSSRPFLWLHFIKRSIIEQEPTLRINENLDLGEDQLFQFMYFPRAKKVVVIDDKLYRYNWYHEGSLMWEYNNMRTEKFEKHLLIVENVLSYWNKENYEDTYGCLISWAVDFLYDDLIKFPPYMKNGYAKKFMSILENTNQHIYMCNDSAKEKGEEIQKLAMEDVSFDDNFQLDILSLKKDVQLTEQSIQRALHSKRFKLGRLLVPFKKRLDIQTVLPTKQKKN